MRYMSGRRALVPIGLRGSFSLLGPCAMTNPRENRLWGQSVGLRFYGVLGCIVLGWLLICIPSGALAGGTPTEYSAEQSAQIGKMTVVSTIYVKGEKTRVEAQQNGKKTVTIYRKDKGFLWVLWPEHQAYMEAPLSQADSRREGDPLANEERSLLGRERVNGYDAEHFKVVVKGLEGQLSTSQEWVAKELQGLVVRRKTDLGQVDIHNVVVGIQPEDLFEIPKGFRKISFGPPGKKE
jgi:Domain of unknown function (DUF4412)